MSRLFMSRRWPSLRHVATGLVAMFMLAVVAPAQARDYCTTESVNGSSTYQYYAATTIRVGRDARVGDVIGPWLSANADAAWECRRSAADAGETFLTGVEAFSPYSPALGTLELGGETYAVYRLGDASDPLAYIARWRTRVDGQTSSWNALVGAPLVYQQSNETVPITRPNGARYSLSVETQIRFVIREGPITPGYQNGIVDTHYVRPFQIERGSARSAGPHRISQFPSDSALFLSGGTCITPDVDVALGRVNASELARSPQGPLTAFSLRFQDCPAGLSRIRYRLSPTTSLVNGIPGVVTLDSSATASGVGVRVLDEDEQPIRFNTLYGLANYDPSRERSYVIPMRAGIYRIADDVTPGSVSTAVTFTLDYQ